MPTRFRVGTLTGAFAVLFLTSCVGSDVSGPDVPTEASPSFAILDGSTGGSEAFYFLPPIVGGTPTIIGTFNPDVLPAVRVCELDMLGGACVAGPPAVEFPAGSAQAGNNKYSLSWDTDAVAVGTLLTDRYYRLEVLLGQTVLGWIELDPQDPDGPGQSVADAYAFRLGETVPLQFWVGEQVLCDPSAYVTECITGGVIDELGAFLSLDSEGPRLALRSYPDGLPGEDHPPITATLERIDPALFLAATGEECIPYFDAPQFAECFRITTDPVLTDPLDVPALVSICIDPLVLAGIDLSEDQQDQLTMVRYFQNVWEALPDAPGDCPAQSASLLRVPDDGLLRYAALGVNALARLMGPTPVAASDIRFGGFSSSFSRFRYALPGEMVAIDGDGTVLQAADPAEVSVTVQVVDHEEVPVEGATVHFSTSDGSLSATDIVTGADGNAVLTWTVDKGSSGTKVLTATGLGLLADHVPDHAQAYGLTTQSIDVTVNVVGAPAAITQTPTGTIAGTAGESAGDLTVNLVDAGGFPVAGVSVTWVGDGTIVGGGTTDENGDATGEWILPETAGNAQITASAGSLSATFDATVAPGAATQIVTTGGGGTAAVGSTIPVTVTVTDQFGNPREGDPVVWTVTGGGGSITGAMVTDASGSAAATWTLGEGVGANTALVSVGDLQANLEATYSVQGVCFDGFGTASVDGVFDAAEWACAETLPFMANISGGTTDAEVHWMNDGTDLFLAVRVRQSSLAKANSVRFDFDNDGDGMVEAGDDVIGYDFGSDTFLDQSLDQKCVNSNQSGCSVGGEPVDGDGAVGNDGQWTVFELVHPLDGTDPADFSLTTGDEVGFFLTLRVGNGAQGNTQFPGFRQYTNIEIVGF